MRRNNFLITGFLAVILLFSTAFAAQAQTPEVTDDAAAEILLDESVTAEDLGVKDPAILPDSPFYVFKDFWRGVQIALTFNKVKEANLRLQHANERLIEVQKMLEEKGNDNAAEKISEAIAKHEEDLAKAEEIIGKVKDKVADNQKLGDFIDKFADNEIKRRKVLQNIETKAPEAVMEKIKEAKEKAAEHFSNILEKVPSEQIVERLRDILQKQKGSELKDLKQLQIIKELTEDAPEEFKDRIAEVGEKLKEHFDEAVGEMTSEQKERLRSYFEDIKGDERVQLNLMEELRTRTTLPWDVRQSVEDSAAGVKDRFEEKFGNIKDENIRARILQQAESDDDFMKLNKALLERMKNADQLRAEEPAAPGEQVREEGQVQRRSEEARPIAPKPQTTTPNNAADSAKPLNQPQADAPVPPPAIAPKPSIPFWQNVTDNRDELKAKGGENNEGVERVDLQYQQEQAKEDYDENIPDLPSRVNELKDEYADEIGGEAQ